MDHRIIGLLTLALERDLRDPLVLIKHHNFLIYCPFPPIAVLMVSPQKSKYEKTENQRGYFPEFTQIEMAEIESNLVFLIPDPIICKMEGLLD